MIVNPHDFGSELLEALDLKGRHITRIVLDVRANHLPRVRITEDLKDKEADGFVQVTKRYTLIPKE